MRFTNAEMIYLPDWVVLQPIAFLTGRPPKVQLVRRMTRLIDVGERRLMNGVFHIRSGQKRRACQVCGHAESRQTCWKYYECEELSCEVHNRPDRHYCLAVDDESDNSLMAPRPLKLRCSYYTFGACAGNSRCTCAIPCPVQLLPGPPMRCNYAPRGSRK